MFVSSLDSIDWGRDSLDKEDTYVCNECRLHFFEAQLLGRDAVHPSGSSDNRSRLFCTPF